MKRNRLLVVAGATLLLILAPCNMPADEEVKPEDCKSKVSARGATASWYDMSTLVYVEPGPFTMGTAGGADNPEHQVELDDFWIYRTEVTNTMYAACVAAGACSAPSPEAGLPDYTNPAFKDHPVVGVTWVQADSYCKWVEGRLPTEAEWEKAARSSDARPFPWGSDEPDCDRINFQQCVRELTSVIDYPEGASPYDGLDHSGNAFEWVADWYSPTYYHESPPKNPIGPLTGDRRALRGGSFESTLDIVRTYTRGSDDPQAVRADLGFRCIIEDAQCYAPACEVASTVGRPWSPRHPPPDEPSCEPPAIDVQTTAKYCQKKYPYVNIDPNGADVTWPDGVNCHVEGDLVACTGDQEQSFDIEACSSCIAEIIPVAPAPTCPVNYTLDASRCGCRFAGHSPGTPGPSTPLFTMMALVPAQECCEVQPGSNQRRVLPRCGPGLSLTADCGCTGLMPGGVEVKHCETVTVTLPTCGGDGPNGGCPPQPCDPKAPWDAGKCCCAINGRCL